jgi:hypothetical protein
VSAAEGVETLINEPPDEFEDLDDDYVGIMYIICTAKEPQRNIKRTWLDHAIKKNTRRNTYIDVSATR